MQFAQAVFLIAVTEDASSQPDMGSPNLSNYRCPGTLSGGRQKHSPYKPYAYAAEPWGRSKKDSSASAGVAKSSEAQNSPNRTSNFCEFQGHPDLSKKPAVQSTLNPQPIELKTANHGLASVGVCIPEKSQSHVFVSFLTSFP